MSFSRIMAKIIYVFILVPAYVVKLTPFILKHWIATVLANLWYYFLPFRKKIILKNIEIVFPEKSAEWRHNLCLQNLKHYILMLFEVIERNAWTRQTILERVKIYGWENVDPILQKNRSHENPKKGLFLLTAHLGNWEIATLTGCLLGVPLATITRFMRIEFLDELWVLSRERFGLELMNESHSGLSVLRALKEGKAIGFILDQHTGRPHGIEAEFLGQKAWCPKGLALMASRGESPIVPVYIIRDAQGYYHLHIEKPLEIPAPQESDYVKSKLSDEYILKHLKVCNDNMEKWIRRYPEQYNWLHRRFKNLIKY